MRLCIRDNIILKYNFDNFRRNSGGHKPETYVHTNKEKNF